MDGRSMEEGEGMRWIIFREEKRDQERTREVTNAKKKMWKKNEEERIKKTEVEERKLKRHKRTAQGTRRTDEG